MPIQFRPARILALLMSFTSMMAVSATQANAQIFDSSFSGDGQNQVHVGGVDSFCDMDVHSDGSVFLLGSTVAGSDMNLVIAKLDSSGELDAGFGGFGPMPDGVVVTDIFADDVPGAIKVLDDGKILVACSTTQGPMLLRYEDSGHLDITFGPDSNGKSLVDAPFHELPGPLLIGHDTVPFEMEIVENDKILIATNHGLVRCNSDGTRDMTYADDGMARPDGVLGVEFESVAMCNDGGRTYVLGNTFHTEHPVHIVAYNADGSHDVTSGDQAVIRPPSDILEQGDAITAHDDVLTVAGGHQIIRIHRSGILDGNFSIDGVVETVEGATVTGVTLMPYGRVAATVDLPSAIGRDFAVVRFLPGGQLDPSFAHSTFGAPTDGWFIADYGISAIAKQVFSYANSKLLVVGQSRHVALGEEPGPGQDILAVRLNPTVEGPPTGGGNGAFDGDQDLRNPSWPNRGSVMGQFITR